MPSNYKAKQPKPVGKQMPLLKELALQVAAIPKAKCTNCGAINSDSSNRFSKCRCGGTYQ